MTDTLTLDFKWNAREKILQESSHIDFLPSLLTNSNKKVVPTFSFAQLHTHTPLAYKYSSYIHIQVLLLFLKHYSSYWHTDFSIKGASQKYLFNNSYSQNQKRPPRSYLVDWVSSKLMHSYEHMHIHRSWDYTRQTNSLDIEYKTAIIQSIACLFHVKLTIL